jgi:hypothetical protein
MAQLRKLACSFLAFGSVAMLGGAMVTGSLGAHTREPFPGVFNSAVAQAGSAYRDASSEVAPQLKTLADSTTAFVSNNATTGRLQFEGMANEVKSHMSVDALTPNGTPQWAHGGIQQAAQVSGGQMISLSAKLPVVQAMKSGVVRLGDLQPSLR